MSKNHGNALSETAGLTYFFREGLTNVFVHGFTSFAAVTVIAACLMITGIFSLVAYNIDLQILKLEGESEIVIYIDDTVSREDAIALGSKISAIENIKELQFVPKEQLFEDYLASLGDEAYVMEELREDNPLRDSYQINMVDVSRHAETVSALEKIEGIASSSSSQEVSDRLIKLRQVTKQISYTLIVLLGAVSIFIVSNTVKLAMLARREEIAIMKMVGATDHFIRIPFIIEGMVLGLLAATLSFFVLWSVYQYVGSQLAQGTAILSTIPFTNVWKTVLGWMLVAGLSFGIGGSVLTIRKYLKV